MRAVNRLRIPDSIFSRTLLLILTTVLLLTAVNVGIILLRSPPFATPITANEVARLLNDKPIAKLAPFQRNQVAVLPSEFRSGDRGDVIAIAIARRLGVLPEGVRVRRMAMRGPSPPGMEEQLRREFRLYAADGDFNPSIFGPFSVAQQHPDGHWTIVSSLPTDTFLNWRYGLITRILLTLLAVLPIAWMFARRLARPIRSFAQAADQLGRLRRAEPLAVKGPQEIRQAVAAMNDMQTRLRRYLAERTSMIGAIAHDLRTPLSRLQFHLARAPDDVRIRAEGEIEEMEKLITATLEFVQNEGRPRVREQVDLGLLVEGVVDDFADLGHDVRTVAVEPTTISGDPILLRRLFANLIGNAVTYGSKTQASLEVMDGQAIVEIADSGPGLESIDLERAFEPFYRAESSRNRATGGMGLGLAIVKDAALAHGGEVSLSNRPGGGLVARVVLPLA